MNASAVPPFIFLFSLAISGAVFAKKTSKVEMPMDLQGIYETSQKTCSQAVAKYKKDPEDAENRPYLLINKTSVIFSNISFCKVLKVAASNGGHKVSMSCIDEGEPGKYKVTSVYKLQNSVLQDQGNGKTFSYAKCASFN